MPEIFGNGLSWLRNRFDLRIWEIRWPDKRRASRRPSFSFLNELRLLGACDGLLRFEFEHAWIQINGGYILCNCKSATPPQGSNGWAVHDMMKWGCWGGFRSGGLLPLPFHIMNLWWSWRRGCETYWAGEEKQGQLEGWRHEIKQNPDWRLFALKLYISNASLLSDVPVLAWVVLSASSLLRVGLIGCCWFLSTRLVPNVFRDIFVLRVVNKLLFPS